MRTICIVVIHSFTELWKMPVEFLDIRYPGRTCSYLESNLPSNQNFFLWEKSDYSWTKSILHLRIEIRSGWILIPLFKNSLFLYYYLLIIIFHANYKPTFFLDFIFYLFLERGEGKERERNISVWWPLEHPLLGTWPAIQASALTGDRTGDPLVLRPALNPLSHTSQG